MADKFYSGSLGNDKVAIAKTGTTTAGAHVEVRITYTATGLDKHAVINLLEHIENRIVEDTWPPA